MPGVLPTQNGRIEVQQRTFSRSRRYPRHSGEAEARWKREKIPAKNKAELRRIALVTGTGPGLAPQAELSPNLVRENREETLPEPVGAPGTGFCWRKVAPQP